MPSKNDLKIHDTSASDSSKNRLVVSNRPFGVNPEVDGGENSKQTDSNLVSTHKSVIKPLSSTEDIGLDTEAKVPESSELPSAEPKTETSSEADTQTTAEPDPISSSPADDSIGDDSADDSSDDDNETEEKPTKPDEAKAAADAARAEQLATYEAIAASGKYYLPIKTSSERRWVTVLLILVAVLLALLALDLLLDANILKINNFSPPTNLFH